MTKPTTKNIQITTLPNGVRVVSETVTYVQSASVGLLVGIGSRDESNEEHMVAQRQYKYISPEQYLAAEDKAEAKSEYYDGVIVAMSGATPEHNKITFDLTVTLGSQLQRGNCQGFASDLRVRVPVCNNYFYPDVSVACEEPRYEIIQGLRALLNPALIVEVLSNSTEQADRGNKFRCYQTLESLQAYVLVSQYRPRIEVFTRQEDGSWQYRAFEGMDAVAPLPTIGCELRLADVYSRMIFPPELEEDATAASAEETE